MEQPAPISSQPDSFLGDRGLSLAPGTGFGSYHGGGRWDKLAIGKNCYCRKGLGLYFTRNDLGLNLFSWL